MPFQNKLRSSLVFRFKYFSFKFSENRARSNLLLLKKSTKFEVSNFKMPMYILAPKYSKTEGISLCVFKKLAQDMSFHNFGLINS